MITRRLILGGLAATTGAVAMPSIAAPFKLTNANCGALGGLHFDGLVGDKIVADGPLVYTHGQGSMLFLTNCENVTIDLDGYGAINTAGRTSEALFLRAYNCRGIKLINWSTAGFRHFARFWDEGSILVPAVFSDKYGSHTVMDGKGSALWRLLVIGGKRTLVKNVHGYNIGGALEPSPAPPDTPDLDRSMCLSLTGPEVVVEDCTARGLFASAAVENYETVAFSFGDACHGGVSFRNYAINQNREPRSIGHWCAYSDDFTFQECGAKGFDWGFHLSGTASGRYSNLDIQNCAFDFNEDRGDGWQSA